METPIRSASDVVQRVSQVQEARRNLDDGLAEDLKNRLYADVLRAISMGPDPAKQSSLSSMLSYSMTLASLALEAELESVK